MEITFRGQYDKGQFYKSVMLANQPPKNRRIVQSFMLAFILVAIVVLVIRLIETRDIFGNAIYITVVMLISAFLARSYLQPYLAARSMWSNPAVQRKLVGVVTKKGIEYRLEAGISEIPWERFTRMRKARNLVTLVTREGLLVIFPRTFFKNESDWQKFERLVDTKIVSLN
ncbi:MAG: YcxB family protein [Anaerolineales bacterium]|jgi:hypothetical protein